MQRKLVGIVPVAVAVTVANVLLGAGCKFLQVAERIAIEIECCIGAIVFIQWRMRIFVDIGQAVVVAVECVAIVGWPAVVAIHHAIVVEIISIVIGNRVRVGAGLEFVEVVQAIAIPVCRCVVGVIRIQSVCSFPAIRHAVVVIVMGVVFVGGVGVHVIGDVIAIGVGFDGQQAALVFNKIVQHVAVHIIAGIGWVVGVEAEQYFPVVGHAVIVSVDACKTVVGECIVDVVNAVIVIVVVDEVVEAVVIKIARFQWI